MYFVIYILHNKCNLSNIQLNLEQLIMELNKRKLYNYTIIIQLKLTYNKDTSFQDFLK